MIMELKKMIILPQMIEMKVEKINKLKYLISSHLEH